MDSHGNCDDLSPTETMATDLMTTLLNQLRDYGYNPSNHIFYDTSEQYVRIDHEILEKHGDVAQTYAKYRQACTKRQRETRPLDDAQG